VIIEVGDMTAFVSESTRMVYFSFCLKLLVFNVNFEANVQISRSFAYNVPTLVVFPFTAMAGRSVSGYVVYPLHGVDGEVSLRICRVPPSRRWRGGQSLDDVVNPVMVMADRSVSR